MKIAMIGWEYPPFKAGGLATHCYGLTRSLADKDVKLDFSEWSGKKIKPFFMHRRSRFPI